MSDTYVGKFEIDGTSAIVYVYARERPGPVHRPLSGPAQTTVGDLEFFTDRGESIHVDANGAYLASTGQRLHKLPD